MMLLAALLAGCGTIVSQTFIDVGDSIPTPTPDESPSAEETAGSFMVVDLGGPVDGPGISLAEAIANADGEPKLVAGVLLMDRDGVIWLCEEIADSSPPSCCLPPRAPSPGAARECGRQARGPSSRRLRRGRGRQR